MNGGIVYAIDVPGEEDYYIGTAHTPQMAVDNFRQTYGDKPIRAVYAIVAGGSWR